MARRVSSAAGTDLAGASRACRAEHRQARGTPHGKKYREIHDAAPADAVALLIDMA
jgi:hypothetical protein